MTAEEMKREIELIDSGTGVFSGEVIDLCCKSCEKGQAFYERNGESCYYHGITEDEFLNECLETACDRCGYDDRTILVLEILVRRLEKVLTSVNERLQKLEEKEVN